MRFYNSFLLLYMLVVLTNTVFSQDRDTTLKTKNGIEILPQKGDVAIQFDASPAINYMGNLFSSLNVNAVMSITFNPLSMTSLKVMVSYFKAFLSFSGSTL